MSGDEKRGAIWAAVAIAIVYAFTAFVAWDLNPGHWHIAFRSGIAMVAPVLAGAAAIVGSRSA